MRNQLHPTLIGTPLIRNTTIGRPLVRMLPATPCPGHDHVRPVALGLPLSSGGRPDIQPAVTIRSWSVATVAAAEGPVADSHHLPSIFDVEERRDRPGPGVELVVVDQQPAGHGH